MINAFDLALKEQMAICTGLPDSSFTAEINIGAYSIDAIAVVAYTQRQAYMTDMFEEHLLTVVMQPSEYAEGVLVGHEDISIKLTQRPYEGGTAFTKRFRAILTDARDERIEGNIKDVSVAGQQDYNSISVITFQLISEASYDLMLREYGNIFINTTPINVMKKILSSFTLKDRYDKSERVATINIDTVDDPKTYTSIKIPDGTPMLAIPDYLQNHYGIFQHGMGCFLKNQSWYIFAPYNTAKKDQDVQRLVVFNAPASEYRSIERNFRISGKTLTVIATGNTKHARQSDSEAINGGTGVRYASLRSLESGMITADTTADLKTTPSDYMTEYRGSNYANAYQKTVTAKERFTDNPYKHSSELAGRGGDTIQLQWDNGTLDPLIPGMPVKYYNGINGKVTTQEGTLISAEMMSSIPLGGIIEPKHRTQVVLTLWLRRF